MSRVLRLSDHVPVLDSIPPREQWQVDLERAEHAKRNVRLYRNGIRMFRVRHARGDIVHVTSIDVTRGVAVCRGLRRRVRPVPLCDLFPYASNA